ncbi:MAG TPA: methylmalonyl-CoA mutase family protein [Xanthobacteraceae bacterium]|nr:methylmalonyl-CoA mutase family protein [Xanthobacteraceae bacterium]
MNEGFPPASRADWLKLVDGVLKGAPYERRMTTRTPDGLVLDALPERRRDARPIAGRALGAPWRIVARIDHTDPAAANTQVLEDLTGGADGLALVFASSPAAYGFGLPETPQTLARVLDGVLLDLVTLRVEAGGGRELALALADHVAAQGLEPVALDIRFGLDPLSDPSSARTAADLRARGFAAPLVRADGRVHHDAGATDAQELAAVLSTMVAHLRALEAAGLPLDDAAAAIEATLAAEADQFATLAKLRALRLLWARVLESCGLDVRPLALHTETAWRGLTRRDPHTNLLRGTIAAFAAGVGGADSVSVLPFTQALGLPDAFARRLARNTQIILMEESNVHRVADPGAGAGAVEERTEKLAAAAWQRFRALEAAGGIVAARADGSWAAEIAAARRTRTAEVATRKTPIIGTSEFALLGEHAVAVLAPLPADAPVPPRLAEPFERLRDAAEAAAAPPRIFLATLGPVAAHTARLGFARALFEAGGIAALDGPAEAFESSGAALACLCGADEAYAAQAEAAARALKAAGARHLYLAGRPGEAEAALRAAGIDRFAFAGCDAVALLTDAQAALGLGSQ